MGFSEFFGWGASRTEQAIPDIFPMPISQNIFVETDIVAIYSKILTDTLERTHGMTNDQIALMWDNCVKSNSTDGLITLLAKAMADRKELFIVYDKAVGVVRLATPEEQSKIKTDYEKSASSATGVYISFQNFCRSNMVKLYIGLEYCSVASLFKSMNLSKAVQIKISDLRASVSLVDANVASAQASNMAMALAGGTDLLMDAKDSVETATPDLTAVKASVEFLVHKLSFYLGLPAAYLIGEQTGGLGTTGEGDTKAIERGLKAYFFSIIKPVVDEIFGVTVTYKSQDTTQIVGAMEVLKTFALTDESIVSLENKTTIMNEMLGLEEDAKGDEPKEPAPLPGDPNAKANPKNIQTT